MKKTLALIAFAGIASVASADVLVVDISGWQSDSGYGGLGNTFTNIALPAGSTIDNISYDIDFTTQGGSWRSELTLSVNDSIDFIGGFWDASPSADSSGGNFVGSGNFADAPGGAFGGPFVLTTGDLYIEIYESFNDAGVDAIVNSGTITITYTPIPAPGALALLGLAGVAARRRRA